MQIKQTDTVLRETRSSLVEVFNNHNAGSLAIGDQQFDDLIQKYFLTKTRNETYEKVIKPMITRNLYEAEGRAAGSAEIFLRLLFSYLDPSNKKFANVDWKQINTSLNFYAKIKPRKTEIVDFINQQCSPVISSIIIEAITNAQKDDQIEVTRGFDLKTSMSLIAGCNFSDLKIDPAYFYNKDWKRSSVNVILVDGVIEKSIHVEHILMISNKENTPYLIICREASDEVKNACLTNFLRQTTDTILCTAPYSEKTAHIFEDLKLITNSDVVCPELGDIITASIYKKATIANRVEINRSGICIENKNEEALKAQRERLIKSMNEINDDDVSDLIRKRIKSLSSNRLLIKVGNDVLSSNRSAIEQIDKVLREMKDSFATGLVETSKIIPFSKFDKRFCSTNSIRLGIASFSSFIKVVEESGLILIA